MILRSLLRRKTRTVLTLIGIAIGVAAVVSMGAMAEGFINSYTTLLSSSGADIIVAQSDAGDILFSAVDETVGPQLAALPGVEKISGVLIGMVTTPDVPYFIVLGLDPGEFGMDHFRVVEGLPIRGPRQILLGRTAAKSFQRKVGDSFKFLDVTFRIVGLFETGQAIEEWGGVVSLNEAQEVFKRPLQVTYYQVKARRAEMVPSILETVKGRFAKLTASRSTTYMDDQMETEMFRAMGWFIGLLASIAGGLIMMNTMLMSVYERTREIGVLRALGWRRGRVLGLILGQALILGLLGGIAGILLGLGLIEAANRTPAVASMLQASVTPMLFVQAMAAALALGAVGGLYPAWRAAGLQPVEAMRYEGGTGARSAPGKPTGGRSAGAPTLVGSAVAAVTRSLPRQRTRTILTAAGIGLSFSLVVGMGGVTAGFIEQFTKMGDDAGDLVVTEAKASDMTLSAIDDRVGPWIATLPQVESVSGVLIGFAQVSGSTYFMVFGADPTSRAMAHYRITEGARMRGPREMVMGKVAAENLKKKVGDTIRVLGNSYRIVGLYETGVGYEDGGGLLTLAEAQSVLKKADQVSFYGIKLKDPAAAEPVRRQIEARHPQLSVSISSEFAEKGNDIKTTRAVMDALVLVAFLVGGVATLNTMMMSVYERTREIGTLRALGWRKWRVMAMILRESVALSLISGVAGIVMGIGFVALLGLEPTMGYFFQATYSVRLLAQTLLLALLLGAVGALYPAWRASSLSPIEALRYE